MTFDDFGSLRILEALAATALEVCSFLVDMGWFPGLRVKAEGEGD